MISGLVNASLQAAANTDERNAAEFASGLLYGVSSRHVDKRAELYECFAPQDGLVDQIDAAFTLLQSGQKLDALKAFTGDQMRSAYKKGLAGCSETNDIFDTVVAKAKAFWARSDHKEIVKANYKSNPGYVDTEAKNGIQQWSYGAYFNAGMFMGEDIVFLTNTADAPEPTPTPTPEPTPQPDSRSVDPAPTPAGTDADAGQFAAGFLYGVSGRHVDKRDDIMACFTTQDGLISMIDNAMAEMQQGHNYAAMKVFASDDFKSAYKSAMGSCSELGGVFGSVIEAGKAFFARDDHRDIMKTNYHANKAFVDQETANAIKQWTVGVYFDVGMFLGEDWATMTKVPESYEPTPAPTPVASDKDMEPAEWSAGYLYGVTGRKVDKRDYINSCWTPQAGLADMVEKYANAMAAKDWDTANKLGTSDEWMNAFAAGYAKCDEVNGIWDKINKRMAAFSQREDAQQIMQQNYNDHKDFIDTEFKRATQTLQEGNYFNNGMFIGEDVATLVTVPADFEHGSFAPVITKDASQSDGAAQWVAGYLYGVTGRRVDKRDEILACWTSVEGLDDLVDEYMLDLSKGDYKALSDLGTSDEWTQSFATAMAACDEPNKVFDKVNKEQAAFWNRSDAQDLMKANYQANKAFVDLETQRAVTQWTVGVYFDAGMFVGEDVATLTTVPQ